MYKIHKPIKYYKVTGFFCQNMQFSPIQTMKENSVIVQFLFFFKMSMAINAISIKYEIL